MRAVAGQVARHANRLLHLVAALLLLALFGAGALAWRLAEAPIELPFLARAIEQQANDGSSEARLTIGHATIAWQGWREGHRSPVELRLSGVRLRQPDGVLLAELPDAAVSLSLPWLLRGELAPGVLELQAPSIRLLRDAAGKVSLQLGEPAGQGAAAAIPATVPSGALAAPVAVPPAAASPLELLLAELMRPPSESRPLGALARLRIAGGRILVEDAVLGRTWALEQATLDLRRLPAGGLAGSGAATLRLGAARLPLTAAAEIGAGPAGIAFRLGLPEVRPALLAAAAPALAPLAMLDAPTRIDLAGRLDATGGLRQVTATLAAEAGGLDLGERGRLAFAGLEAELEAAPDAVRLARAELRLAGPSAPLVSLAGEAALAEGVWRGGLTLGLDAMPLAELERHWPPGVAVHVREWLTENITAGIARNGQWRIEAAVPAADPAALELTGLTGSIEVADATVHWLRPIPPAERAAGLVTFGMKQIDIRVTGGRQSGGGIAVREGQIRFFLEPYGIDTTEMSFAVAGPVHDVLVLLQHPRLKLFERRPPPVREASGSAEARLSLAFPLVKELEVEQVRLRAQARLRDIRIPDVLLGRPLERGQAELTVDSDGLRANGTGTLADIAARIGVEMDFRNGPASQVTMRETVQARTDARSLAALGLASLDLVNGPVGLDVRSERRRNGAGRATIRADLRDAALTLEPLSWSKPPGQNAGGDAVLRFTGDNLDAIETFRLEAPSLLLRGNAAFGRGARLERLTLNEAAVEASRFAGEARPPSRPGSPWQLLLRGPVLDLRRALAEEAPPAPPVRGGAETGPAFAADARFERVLLGPGREIGAVEARVVVDGHGVVQEGRLAGRAGPRGPFEARIAPAGAGRSLRLTAEDAGALLGSFDVLRHLEGGRLTVDAAYAHNRPNAPLTGTAEMGEFAVRQAPGFGKLLQAMTLYGLVEALSGPGLTFSRLVAPFTLTPDTLTLAEARAFSASLGLTAKGTLDRRRRRLQMEGTIVPAYIFNSLLGNLPILGRLFSPETGGGLFAATFRLSGPTEDPQVSVNPLAALTPGFLRGLFGIGQGGEVPP